MAISGTFGTRVVSKCYAPECPPYVHKPPNNRGAYANRPEGARTIQPGASEAAQPRSDALGRRAPKPSKPQPGRNNRQRVAYYEQCSPLARSSLWTLRLRENELWPHFVAPRSGLGGYFAAFPGRRDAGVTAAIALPRARLCRPVGPEERCHPMCRNTV